MSSARLAIMELALDNFPTIKRTSGKTSVSSARRLLARRSPSVTFASGGSSYSISVTGSLLPHRATRNKNSVSNCLPHDEGTCVVTGRKSLEEFPLQVAHIIPFALIKSAECCQMAF